MSAFEKLAVQSGYTLNPRVEYAFTELIKFTFSKDVHLEIEATAEGQLWAKTIQTYVDHPGTMTTWWGVLVESPQVVMLIIDWKSRDDRTKLLSSSEFSSLLALWQSSPTPYSSGAPALFVLPSWPQTRQNVFCLPHQYSEDCVSMVLTFRFSSAFDASAIDSHDCVTPKRQRRQVWSNAVDLFYHAALHSAGGVISSQGAYGWSVRADGGTLAGNQGDGQPDSEQWESFVMIFRFMSLELAKAFLNSADADERSRLGSGIGSLKGLADGGMEVELMRMMGEKTN